MSVRIQLRRDTAANWTSVNPTLLSGEIGIETDTLKFKIGNGQRWNQTTSYAFKAGEANGLATLNSEGKIPTSQLPTALSITADINAAFASMTTSSIAEGTNLYFTDARAVAAVASQIAAEVSARNAAIETAKSQAVTISTTDATNKATAAQQNAIAAAESKDLTAIASATSAANNYTDSKISTEVTNRNSAITSAVAAEATNRGIAINAAIATEVTNRNAAIAASGGGSASFSSKTTDDLAEGSNNLYYSDAKAIAAVSPNITNVLIALNGNIDDLSASIDSTYVKKSNADTRYVLQTGLQNSLDQYVLESGRDSAFGYAGLDASAKLDVAVIPASIARASDVTSSINTAVSTEVTNRNSAISGAINNLINSAPGTLDTLGEIATALQSNQTAVGALTTSIALKAPLASPTFTGTVSGITKTMVGLGNVDNTTDLNKPISTLTQTALDLKAPLASPTFTGAVDFSGATVTGLDTALPSQMGYSNKYLKTDGINASWEDIDLTLYLTKTLAATTYATLDNAKTYGYHNAGSNTAGNKIAYGSSATGYSSISSPAAGDIYIQY